MDEQLHILRELQPWLSQPTLEPEDWVLSCPFCPSAPLVRREWLERVGLFDESMHYIEDWDLWLRMSYLGCQMDWLKEPVCYYRIHSGKMVRHALLMKVGMLTMFDKFYSQSNLPDKIVVLRDRAYSKAYLDAATRAYAAGVVEEGKACLADAIKLNPTLLEGNPPQVLDTLASFALGPLATPMLLWTR